MVSEHSLCQDITIHDDEEKKHQKMLKYMAKCYLLYQVSVVRYFAHLIRVFFVVKNSNGYFAMDSTKSNSRQ